MGFFIQPYGYSRNDFMTGVLVVGKQSNTNVIHGWLFLYNSLRVMEDVKLECTSLPNPNEPIFHGIALSYDNGHTLGCCKSFS